MYTRYIFLSIALMNTTACEFIEKEMEDNLYTGTLLGYHLCLEKDYLSHLAERTAKELCVRKHQDDVLIHVEGKAGYRNDCPRYGPGCGERFEPRITNRSNEYILTGIDIKIEHVDHVDEDEKQVTDDCIIDDLWIEPQRDKVLNCSELSFYPEPRRLAKNEDGEHLFDWQISGTKGIKIDL